MSALYPASIVKVPLSSQFAAATQPSTTGGGVNYFFWNPSTTTPSGKGVGGTWSLPSSNPNPSPSTTSGCIWTPGAPGAFQIHWVAYDPDSSQVERLILRNCTVGTSGSSYNSVNNVVGNVIGGCSTNGTSTGSGSACIYSTAAGIFVSTNATDYVSFGFYASNTTTSNDQSARTFLQITRMVG
jgi:hypothetical protein